MQYSTDIKTIVRLEIKRKKKRKTILYKRQKLSGYTTLNQKKAL